MTFSSVQVSARRNTAHKPIIIPRTQGRRMLPHTSRHVEENPNTTSNLYKIIHFNYVPFVLTHSHPPGQSPSIVHFSVRNGSQFVSTIYFDCNWQWLVDCFSLFTILAARSTQQRLVCAQAIEWNSRPAQNTFANATRKSFALRFKCHSFWQMICRIWYATRKECELGVLTCAKTDWLKEICHSTHSDAWVLTQYNRVLKLNDG